MAKVFSIEDLKGMGGKPATSSEKINVFSMDDLKKMGGTPQQRITPQQQEQQDFANIDARQQTGFNRIGSRLIKGPAEDAGFFSRAGHAMAGNVKNFGQSIAGAVGSVVPSQAKSALDKAKELEQESLNMLAQHIREVGSLNQSTGGSLDKTARQVYGEGLGVATDIIGAGVLPGGVGTAASGRTAWEGAKLGAKALGTTGAIFGASQGASRSMQENNTFGEIVKDTGEQHVKKN
jgi:hypothetical protein